MSTSLIQIDSQASDGRQLLILRRFLFGLFQRLHLRDDHLGVSSGLGPG